MTKQKTEENLEIQIWRNAIELMRPKMEKLCRKMDTGFHVDTDRLSEEDVAISKILLANKNEIVKELVENGLEEDEECPYTYYVPTGLYFDCGKGKLKIHSLWAIVILARASYARANWMDCDSEGFPELDPITPSSNGLARTRVHRVKITDPFAQVLDIAIKDYREGLVREGKARIVNGKFYKVA